MPKSQDSAAVIVLGDAARCEQHAQCDGLSGRVFRAPGSRLVVDTSSIDVTDTQVSLERAVRSCPMFALRIAQTAQCTLSEIEEHS